MTKDQARYVRNARSQIRIMAYAVIATYLVVGGGVFVFVRQLLP